MRVPFKLKLATGQVNSLRLFLEKTSDKREYRRAVAVLQKVDGKTYDYIAREQRVHIISLVIVQHGIRPLGHQS